MIIEKIRIDISCESSRQKIHIKCHALFSQKNNKKKIQNAVATVVTGALSLCMKLHSNSLLWRKIEWNVKLYFKPLSY